MIRYYIPGDGDDATHPNIFHLPPSARNPPTLRDVRQNFPLPGAYHFRFKKRLEGTPDNKPVWFDITEDTAEIPVCDGTILAKVSRLSMDVSAKPTAAGRTGFPSSSSTSPSSSSHSNSGTSSSPTTQSAASPVSRATPPTGGSSSSSRHLPTPPDSDPFGLFHEAPTAPTGGGGVQRNVSAPMSNNGHSPSMSMQRPQGGGGGGGGGKADLLDFDAFGSHPPAAPQKRPMSGTPPPPHHHHQQQQPPPRGYPPSSSGGGWM
ncbi:hypothetical protein VYU27_003263 [Nannochloropsis oceanica]